MRKVVIFILALSLHAAMHAQNIKRHEFSFSTGCGANVAGRDYHRFDDRIVEQFHVEPPVYVCSDLFGPMHLTTGMEYLYNLNKRWAAGGMFGWGYAHSSESDTHSHTFYVAPSLRYVWYEKTTRRAFRCYSKGAVGLLRHHMHYNNEEYQGNRQLTYQATFIGIEKGYRSAVRFYMELGYGCQGVFNMGLKVHL